MSTGPVILSGSESLSINYNSFELTSKITHVYNNTIEATTSQAPHAHPAACRYFKISKGNNVESD